MARQYSAKSFLRQAPNCLLQRYLMRVGRRAELTHIWAKSASALDPPTAMAEGL